MATPRNTSNTSAPQIPEGSILLKEYLASNKLSEIPKEKPLSNTQRGLTQVVVDGTSDARCVVRLTPAPSFEPKDTAKTKHLARSSSLPDRAFAFGSYAFAHADELHGLVRPLRAPSVRNDFVVQVFEELSVSSIGRLNLHEFLKPKNRCRFPGDQLFKYLRDVAWAMRSMHEHGWVHMDLSLGNISLTDDHAYLIDFESALPTNDNFGFLRLDDLRVPMKVSFAPPEHWLANSDEWVSLTDYDVWAFGSLMFTAVFNVYLLPFRICDQRGNIVLDTGAFECFVGNGFARYLRMWRPKVYRLLYGDSGNVLFSALRDLFEHIFVNPIPRQMEGRHAVWTTNTRFGASEICQHPFWSQICES